MKDEWIDEWKFKTSSFDDKGIRNYKFVRMNGYTSTSKSLLTGIKFAVLKKDHTPVLFVISVRNHNSFSGFRMDEKYYSEYSHE